MGPQTLYATPKPDSSKNLNAFFLITYLGVKSDPISILLASKSNLDWCKTI